MKHTCGSAFLRLAQVIVGSCPRCAADVDRLVDEAQVESILCLQARQTATSQSTSS